jgi:hypothetical protein
LKVETDLISLWKDQLIHSPTLVCGAHAGRNQLFLQDLIGIDMPALVYGQLQGKAVCLINTAQPRSDVSVSKIYQITGLAGLLSLRPSRPGFA